VWAWQLYGVCCARAVVCGYDHGVLRALAWRDEGAEETEQLRGRDLLLSVQVLEMQLVRWRPRLVLVVALRLQQL
jgi:hypothetical protein